MAKAFKIYAPAREFLFLETEDLTFLSTANSGVPLSIASQLEAHDPLEAPGAVTGGGVEEAVLLDVESEHRELG